MEIFALLKSSWKMILSAMAWCCRWLLGRLVRPILLQAHRYHLDLRNWQCRWESLGDTLEYKLVLASVLTNNTAPTSSIYLRNVGSRPLRDLSVSVVAKNGKLQFSAPVSVPHLDVGAVERHRLDNIPLQDMWCNDSGICVSYETVHVVLNSYECDGKQVLPRQTTLEASIMYGDFLDQGCWTRFQDRLYNIKAIDDYITHHQHWLYHHLASKRGLFFPLSRARPWHYIKGTGRYGLLPWAVGYLILSYRPLVTAYCWAKLLVQRPIMRFKEEQDHWWSAER